MLCIPLGTGTIPIPIKYRYTGIDRTSQAARGGDRRVDSSLNPRPQIAGTRKDFDYLLSVRPTVGRLSVRRAALAPPSSPLPTLMTKFGGISVRKLAVPMDGVDLLIVSIDGWDRLLLLPVLTANPGNCFLNVELGEEKRCLDSELWHACAGPLVCLPTAGTRVVYFPQGHIEQVKD
ncbi:hypothetical protein GW17_00020208 [Ensete ventricosum]|nr:hypothetical protein GW17_00020208 [Ensete ventricosum]